MTKSNRNLGSLVAFLDERRVRVTPIRRAVLRVLLANKEPLRVEDTHRLLTESGPRVDLVTVYRTLELFVKVGLVRPVRFHEDSARYELSDVVRPHHHHHVCVSCGRISDITACLPDTVTKQVEREANVVVTSHMLEFFGQCSSCKKRGSKKK